TAERIHDALRTRIEQAKSIRAYTRTMATMPGQPEASEVYSGFSLKGADQWLWEYEWKGAELAGLPRRTTVQCDGRKILSDGVRNPEILTEFQPATVASELRVSLALGLPSSLAWLQSGRKVVQSAPKISGLKDLGTERLGGREGRLLEYQIKVVAPQFEG